MKKMYIDSIKKLCKYSAASFLAALFATGILSCEIGLGPGVDMIPPHIEITSHQDNDSVAQTFVLRGTASDNEAVTLITIDFDDADIHYQVVPGENWQKKTSKTGDWKTVPEDSNNYCKLNDTTWTWSIDVDTDEKAADKTGATYNLLAVAKDEMGNSGKESRIDRSLIVDTESPNVTVYKPEYFSSYTDLHNDVEANIYKLKDGNVIGRLLNGTVEIFGRQDQALAFKALRIEFDNGIIEGTKSTANSTTAVESLDEVLNLPEAQIGDATAPDVYFAKNVSGEDLREWSLTVNPEEWATSEAGKAKGLDTGLHIIRVISTSISTSNAWQRKVLGYFLWYSEADTPWITVAAGDDTEKDTGAYECYPGSNISGSIQDDDGIKSFVSTLYKKNGNAYELYTYSETDAEDAKLYENPKTHALPQDKAKYSAWSVVAPTENGKYKLVLKVTDIYGKTDEVTKYFHASDVSAPKIKIESPENGSSAIQNVNGNIQLKGSVSDDGKIENFTMVWLNPALRDNPANKIKYLTGTDPDWDRAGTGETKEDDDGNIIYRFNVPANAKTYDFDSTFNLFTKFGVGGKDKKGNLKPLTSQEFVFRAYDGNSYSVKSLTLSGDTIAPTLSFTTIEIGGETKSISGTPTFASSAEGKTATISGTWNDYFTSSLKNTTKVYKLNLKWGDNEKEVTPGADGKWKVEITAPRAGGTITASLTDYAGNSKTIQEAVRIETSAVGLARIGCLNDDGSYNAGKKIYITLEFTKNTKVEGTPILNLNNGGTAIYKNDCATDADFKTLYGEGYGDGKAIHVFEYTVGTVSTGSTEKDTADISDKCLSVSSINLNGANWKDAASNNVVTNDIYNPEDPNNATKFAGISNLKGNRSIVIDRKAPTIERIYQVTSDGWYKKDASILLMLEFDEAVNITNASKMKLEFNHDSAVTSNAEESGSKYVLFTYNVAESHNADPLKVIKLEKESGAAVTDMAGNPFSGWEDTLSYTFSEIHIDTNAPKAPKFVTASGEDWKPADIIFDSQGTSFKLTNNGEENIESMEYKINDGSWIPYSGEVRLTNDGTYTIKARQTDKAGNETSEANISAAAKSFIIDKGELLTRLTADTVSGAYSTNTNTKVIKGRIEFGKTVQIAKESTITLNVKHKNQGDSDPKSDSDTQTVDIIECNTDSAKTKGYAEGKVFTFEFPITEGDNSDGYLDVTAFSFSKVKVQGKEVAISLPDEDNSKRFKKNRSIEILTGKPKLASDSKFELKEENGTSVLKIEFDRKIKKVGGKITLTQDISSGKYHVPAVLSSEEYNELTGIAAIKDTIQNAYKKGVNGANLIEQKLENGVTRKYLENDVTTKYILDFNTDDTDSTLITAFTTSAKKHIVEIPVVADEVTIEDADEDGYGRILKVDLSETYKLPVKGADYTMTIPANAVTDKVQNKNAVFSKVRTAAGVENPVIRLQKPKYTIGNPGNTTNPNVNMAIAQSAKFRIDCRTPSATIKYKLEESISAQKTEDAKDKYVDTKTADPTPPASATEDYDSSDSENNVISVASGDNYLVDSYANAKGVKIAILAEASANGDTKQCYEYATRTVLKFNINTYEGVGSETDVIGTYDSKELQVWVMGGESPYGNNSNNNFPLSWSDPTKFMIMKGAFSSNDMKSQWYLVTWDITSATYHGFVIGDVPSDVRTKGPTKWIPGENSWVTQKKNYVLYPGETLLMDTANSLPTYWFRGSRVISRP